MSDGQLFAIVMESESPSKKRKVSNTQDNHYIHTVKLEDNEQLVECDSTLSKYGAMVKGKDNKRFFVCLASVKCREEQKRMDSRNAQRHIKVCCPTREEEEKFVFNNVFGTRKLNFCSTSGQYQHSFPVLNFKIPQSEHLIPGVRLCDVEKVLNLDVKALKPNLVFRFHHAEKVASIDYFVRQQDIVELMDLQEMLNPKSSSRCVVILDLDETVVSLQHSDPQEIRKHDGKIAEGDSFTVAYQGENMLYVIRPFFSEFKTLLMNPKVDAIVYSHSHQALAELIVSKLQIDAKSVHGRRPKEECVSKCLSHIPEAYSYDHIVILDDDPKNFSLLTSSTGNQVHCHRLPVTKFYWQNYERDTNLKAILPTIQCIISSCQS